MTILKEVLFEAIGMALSYPGFVGLLSLLTIWLLKARKSWKNGKVGFSECLKQELKDDWFFIIVLVVFSIVLAPYPLLYKKQKLIEDLNQQVSDKTTKEEKCNELGRLFKEGQSLSEKLLSANQSPPPELAKSLRDWNSRVTKYLKENIRSSPSVLFNQWDIKIMTDTVIMDKLRYIEKIIEENQCLQ